MNLKKLTGIYQIINKVTFRNYIGFTKRDFTHRFYDHKKALNNNKHNIKELQLDWNLYGENNFEFEVLEIINKSLNKTHFKDRADYWIKAYKSFESIFGYNVKYKDTTLKTKIIKKKKIYNVESIIDVPNIKSSNLKTTAGIYRITNKQNSKCYVGSTRQSFAYRFRDHKRDLKKNKHHNNYLQNAWNKYGEDTFEFEVLELIDKSLDKTVFLEKEYYWITKFNSFDSVYGYNAVANPSDTTKHKLKIKTINKIYRPSLKKIFKKPQCIKGWCPVNYYYVENVITKQQTLISNIVKFAREHNLNPSNLRSTLNGTRYQCNGYKLISLDENKNNHKTAKWLVITPDSKELFVDILKDFCKLNKLQYNSLKQTGYNPKSIQHKGYRCYLLDNVLNFTQQYPKCDFTYKVIEPNGKLHITNSLTRLGNNLEAIDGKTLAHISCGRAIKYVELGWKVISL